jgi:radical SAM superfamily enzyme YgiQ (UPF0313 family)
MKENPRVLFINPSRNLRLQNANEPLWALNLAAVLERQRFSVQILDGTIESINEDKLEDFNFIGVTATTPQYPIALSMLEKIQRINAETKHKIHTIIGGPHITAIKDKAEGDGWDTICEGEGEEIIGNIIKNRIQGRIRAKIIKNLDALPGLSRFVCKRPFFIS